MNIKDIKISKIKTLVGIFLILFSLICFINVGYISQTFVVVFTFLFGYYGYFLILPLLFAFGIYLILKKNNKLVVKINLFFIASFLLIFSCLVYSSFWPHFASGELGITTYNNIFFNCFSNAGSIHIKANDYIHINVLDAKLGGGYIGYFFASCLNSITTQLGTAISTGVLILISIVLYVFYFIGLFNKNDKKEIKKSEEKTIIDLNFDDEHISGYIGNDVSVKEDDVILNNDTNTNLENVIVDRIYSTEVIKASSNNDTNNVNNEGNYINDNKDTITNSLDADFASNNNLDNKIEEEKKYTPFVKPGMDLLEDSQNDDITLKNEESIKRYQELINLTFEQLNIDAKAISYTMGPRVTRFDIKIGEHSSVVQVPKIIPDISQRLGGVSAIFETIVPGKITSGLEIPNEFSSVISFKEIMSKLPEDNNKKLLIPFGKNISGEVKFASLTSFPHLLVAGSTGSGKSVFVHSIIVSFLMKNTPDELKLLLIDPKRVEFSKYKNIPYLLCPPVTDPVKAHVALQKLCEEMDRRYTLFEKTPYNKIDLYNKYAKENNLETIPYIVGIVDEFADLINTNKKVELEISRLAAKSRACGIHLIIATQRPSVDVITGTIKNNLPVRVALRVSDQESSKTILGRAGAEALLGNGDMLVLCPNIQINGFARVQGCYITDEEIIKVVDFIKNQREPQYNPNFMNLDNLMDVDVNGNPIENDEDELIRKIKLDLLNREYVSISLLTRVFSISYNKGGKLISRLQSEGVISTDAEGAKGFKIYKDKLNDVTLSGSDELTSIKKN